MVDMLIFGVTLSTDNPKEPQRVFIVAPSISEVFGIVAKKDEYFKRFVSVDIVAPCKVL